MLTHTVYYYYYTVDEGLWDLIDMLVVFPPHAYCNDGTLGSQIARDETIW